MKVGDVGMDRAGGHWVVWSEQRSSRREPRDSGALGQNTAWWTVKKVIGLARIPPSSISQKPCSKKKGEIQKAYKLFNAIQAFSGTTPYQQLPPQFGSSHNRIPPTLRFERGTGEMGLADAREATKLASTASWGENIVDLNFVWEVVTVRWFVLLVLCVCSTSI
jgi:hypothetical protein